MEDEPVEIPIDGTLDLHFFSPKDLKTLIPDYILECRKKGILEIRLIHGKGIGNIRRSVHAILERLEEVENYKLSGSDMGGWGSTEVVVLPLDRVG